MIYSGGEGGGGINWFAAYMVSLTVVIVLDCLRAFDFRAASIITNCIVFIGMNYIINDLDEGG